MSSSKRIKISRGGGSATPVTLEQVLEIVHAEIAKKDAEIAHLNSKIEHQEDIIKKIQMAFSDCYYTITSNSTSLYSSRETITNLFKKLYNYVVGPSMSVSVSRPQEPPEPFASFPYFDPTITGRSANTSEAPYIGEHPATESSSGSGYARITDNRSDDIVEDAIDRYEEYPAMLWENHQPVPVELDDDENDGN